MSGDSGAHRRRRPGRARVTSHLRDRGPHRPEGPGHDRRPPRHGLPGAAAPPIPPPGGWTGVAGYEIEAVIGKGTTATVYRARKLDGSGQIVALKRLSEDAAPAVARRLRDEAEALAGLDHPHVVRVLELVPDGTGPAGETGVAVAMQHAAGGSLAGVLARRGRLPAEEVVAIAAPLADALASAHRRGLVHGDVKPANILFTSDGEPLLSDFGLARRTEEPAGGGEVWGTAGYVDPAVLDGAPPDGRSDVYSLGAVCHEMLCGGPPGSGVAWPPSPSPPAGLTAVLERALAPRPADRFSDAAEMGAALRAALGGVPAPRRPLAGTGQQATPPLAFEAGPPTRSFGPRPPRPAATGPGRHRAGRMLPVVCAVVLTGAITAIAVLVLGPDASGTAGSPACPEVSAPLQADVDGDGCPSPVARFGNVLEVDGRRYQLGQPGDLVLLGDWDCDGRDTPALYRPGGETYVFDGWAEEGKPLPAVSRAQLPGSGRPEVRRAAGGCDRLVSR